MKWGGEGMQEDGSRILKKTFPKISSKNMEEPLQIASIFR